MVDKIEASDTLGQCTSGCNPKFLVHLRRPKNFDETQGFGFDWFRPEYEEPLTKLFALQGMIEPLYLGKIKELKKLYFCKGVKKIVPYGKEYIPSIISMFSDIDENASEYIKDKQSIGLNLDIEVYEIPEENKKIEVDSTVIEFFCENEFIKISPLKIPLSSLISNGYAKDIIRDPVIQFSQKSKYYRAENAINIKVIGGFISNPLLFRFSITSVSRSNP